MLNQLKYHARKNELESIRKMVEVGGGIEYTLKKIKEISKKAIDEISLFPDSSFKNGLYSMLDFNLNRTK